MAHHEAREQTWRDPRRGGSERSQLDAWYAGQGHALGRARWGALDGRAPVDAQVDDLAASAGASIPAAQALYKLQPLAAACRRLGGHSPGRQKAARIEDGQLRA